MERRLSFGAASSGSRGRRDRERMDMRRDEELMFRGGSAVNYPGNPRFRPQVAFKMAPTSAGMEERKELLSNHALSVKVEGPLGVRSCEELKSIISHHFDIRKHEVYVFRSRPDPFVVIFSERRTRDIVFAAGRVMDDAVELRFNEWELDEFGGRSNIPYHVKLSLEGIPHHAWFQETADRILGDEAVIHHVEESTRRRTDLRAYQCWAFSKDPSRIPQVVFLTLTSFETGPQRDMQIHFVRPREMKAAHVFKVFVHIDVVEDLTFYHFPREDLIADGKVPWREFSWHFGCPDGEQEEEDFNPPPRFCGSEADPRRRFRDVDDDTDRGHKRGRSRGPIHRMTSWMDNRSSFKNRTAESGRQSGWFRGESSRGRAQWHRDSSPVPSRCNWSPEERRALRGLWNSRGEGMEQSGIMLEDPDQVLVTEQAQQGVRDPGVVPDVIVISPQDLDLQRTDVPAVESSFQFQSDAIEIIPNNLNLKEIRTREGSVEMAKVIPEHCHQVNDAPVNGKNQTNQFSSVSSQNIEGLDRGQIPAETVGVPEGFFGTQDSQVQQAPVIIIPVQNSLGNCIPGCEMPPVQISSANSQNIDQTSQQQVGDAEMSPAQTSSASPQHIDQAIQQQGRDLHELLQMFKQAYTEPLASSILQTPVHKAAPTKEKTPLEVSKQKKQRKSPRLQSKGSSGKTIIRKAQQLVARKCGILGEEEDLDAMTLQQYLDMYNSPLTEEAMEAIKKLSEVAAVKKNKKKEKKKKNGPSSKGKDIKKKNKKDVRVPDAETAVAPA